MLRTVLAALMIVGIIVLLGLHTGRLALTAGRPIQHACEEGKAP